MEEYKGESYKSIKIAAKNIIAIIDSQEFDEYLKVELIEIALKRISEKIERTR